MKSELLARQLFLVSLLFLGACASGPDNAKFAGKQNQAGAQIGDTFTAMEPSSPLDEVAVSNGALGADDARSVEVAASTEQGFAGTLKKLQENPFTLYWGKTNTYTFYIGGVLRADYKPGTSLVVRDDSGATNAVECNFAIDGTLKSDQSAKLDCESLMFTLDLQLEE